MNKKVAVIITAILVLFAGIVWIELNPSVGIPVAFIEVLTGFICGFLYNTAIIEQGIKNHKQIVSAIKKESKTLVAHKTPSQRIAEVRAEGKAKGKK